MNKKVRGQIIKSVIARSEATKQSLKTGLLRYARNDTGFMLLEAILSVVVVSICLTFIAQSLLTNFRTGMRFQETIRSLLVMENRLGLLYATYASEDQTDFASQLLDKPYDQFTVLARTDTIDDHLKKVGLILNWPAGQSQGHLDVTTIIYNPNEN